MSTKRLATNAVCIALYFLLTRISLDIGVYKLSFAPLAIYVLAFLYGPADAVIVSAVGSFLQQALSQYGLGPTTIIWMIPVIVRGLVAGIYAKWKNYSMTVWQTGLIVLISSVITTTLNTAAIYFDALYFGYPSGLTVALMISRYVPSLIMAAVFTLITPPVVNLIKRSVRR